MTASDVAMPSGRVAEQPKRARVRARARARLAITQRDVKIGDVAGRIRSDARAWWAVVDQPPSLADWWTATNSTRRVPGDDVKLRAAWRVDNWATGAPLLVLSLLLHTAASGLRWVACHPVRRWMFLALSAATVAVWLIP